ncbi:hypothetical protein GEV33_005789 [Tenebrio molitor]|uniref:Uncharacterized protein n=1 Tax=Tenebrio molitor TaxID=7067 RepID=A0A8J6HMJ7_TENMO|nr:hypothetical protein GEV33_005789 [Tenebrio molitor]
MEDTGRYTEVWKRDGVIPEKYGEMRKGNLWGEIRGRHREILGSFWEIWEKVHGDAGIFGGTPGEDTGRSGRSRGRSGMNGSLWEVCRDASTASVASSDLDRKTLVKIFKTPQDANESISIPPSVRIKIERVRGEEKFFLPPDIWRVYHSVPIAWRDRRVFSDNWSVGVGNRKTLARNWDESSYRSREDGKLPPRRDVAMRFFPFRDGCAVAVILVHQWKLAVKGVLDARINFQRLNEKLISTSMKPKTVNFQYKADYADLRVILYSRPNSEIRPFEELELDVVGWRFIAQDLP